MPSNKHERSCSYAVITSGRALMKRSTSRSSRILILGNPGPTWFIFLHRFDAKMDAFWTNQRQVHRFRAGSNTARGRTPMVGPCRGLGVLSRSMAVGRLCRVLRGSVSPAGGGRGLAERLHRVLGTPAPAYSGDE